MSSLLNILENEAVDNQRRVEAAARRTCDYCGKPYRYGYSGYGAGTGGGYSHRHETVRYDGRYYSVCGDRCRARLVAYLQSRRGRVPRLIGRRTVEEVLR